MEVGASFQASGLTPMPRARRFTPCMSRGACLPTIPSTRRVVVRTDTRRAGSAAHVRELPQRLASICLGCCFVLGNDGIALYAAGQASLEQLISSNLSATPGSPPALQAPCLLS